jgi:phosphoribosylformylglycinamidine (FGAM) synthase PurS component
MVSVNMEEIVEIFIRKNMKNRSKNMNKLKTKRIKRIKRTKYLKFQLEIMNKSLLVLRIMKIRMSNYTRLKIFAIFTTWDIVGEITAKIFMNTKMEGRSIQKKKEKII